MSWNLEQQNTLTPQEQQQEDEALKLKTEEELKTFTPDKAKDFIEKTWELLTIDNAEKKEIIKNLWGEAPDFLAEIKEVDNEFKQIMLTKNNEINNLTHQEYKEREKLFFEKLLVFKNKHEPLFEKIDENDWNILDQMIEATKYNKEKHDISWNNLDAIFDASKDWLSNWLLLWMKKYENLLSWWINWIVKLAWNISDMVEKMWLSWFITMIWESIYNDFKKILDFDQPTYKIAQSIWKFLVDIIIQLISWWIWLAWKLASVINKLVPNWLIKKWLNASVKTWDEFLSAFTWVKPELLSKDWLKSLWLSWTWNAIWNELMYYAWVTPYMVLRDWAKLWISTIELIKKQGFTIDKIAPAIYKTPDWKTIVKLHKFNEKIDFQKTEKALRWLIHVKEKRILPEFSKINDIIKITWIEQKYSNRTENLQKEEKEEYLKNFSNTPLFKEMFWILDSKYLKNKDKFV